MVGKSSRVVILILFLVFAFLSKAWSKNVTVPDEGLFPSKQAQCGTLSLYGAMKLLDTNVDYRTLLKEAGTDSNGTTIKGLVDAAEKQGLYAKAVSVSLNGLCRLLSNAESPMVAICHLESPDHFVVWYLNKNGAYTKIDPLNKVVNTETPRSLLRFSGAAILISKEPIKDADIFLGSFSVGMVTRVVILVNFIVVGLFLGRHIRRRWWP